MACQMLSQFMNIESVFLEVKRVLAPGGVFLFTEEPLRRLLSLRIYRAPYQDRMKPWERKLFDWGLLGYLARDVIGAEQEESFGIRQNHKMYLARLAPPGHQPLCRTPLPALRPGARLGRAAREDARRSMNGARHACSAGRWPPCARRRARPTPLPASTVSKTFSAARIATATSPATPPIPWPAPAAIARPTKAASITCCPPRSRAELYPGDREDVIDFSLPSHTARLGEGWYELEGEYGNKYRWIGPRATAVLRRAHTARSGCAFVALRTTSSTRASRW